MSCQLKRPDIPDCVDAEVGIVVASAQLASNEKRSEVKAKSVFVFKGAFERAARGDGVMINIASSSKKNVTRYTLKRDSIYHILPEYLFHPMDRYVDCEDDKEKLKKCYSEQKRMEDDALSFFYPFDKTLLEERLKFQAYLNDRILRNNTFIADFISQGYRINRRNPFINLAYPCIQWLREYRGVHRAVKTALFIAFGGSVANYGVEPREINVSLDANEVHFSLEGIIDGLFCGNCFLDIVDVFSLSYQVRIYSKKQIETLHKQIDDFVEFFNLWFLGVNQRLRIEFGDYLKVPTLGTGLSGDDLFLNYNTQLIP